MTKLVNKTVHGTLVGVNGNAYALMGHFQTLARRQGWTPAEIKLVIDECTTSNYDHLVATLANHMDLAEEGEDDYEPHWKKYTPLGVKRVWK